MVLFEVLLGLACGTEGVDPVDGAAHGAAVDNLPISVSCFALGYANGSASRIKRGTEKALRSFLHGRFGIRDLARQVPLLYEPTRSKRLGPRYGYGRQLREHSMDQKHKAPIKEKQQKHPDEPGATVDEQIDDSFPASDPPSYNAGGRVGRPDRGKELEHTDGKKGK
jgi:hypothetical protein